MPLNKSKSEGAFHENVSEMIRAGHPQKQALAAAYRVMRGYDDGGTVDPVVLPQNPNPLADNPFSHYVAQKLYGLGQGVVDAATLPGDVYAGRTDPTSEEGGERAFNLAQMMTGTPRGGSLGSGIILPKGIRAYHGSPYDFDRFDMNQIGTGEGAQAYGHGLYFAENEGTARFYRDSLSDLKPRAIADNPDLTLPSWVANKVASRNPIAINDVRNDFQARLAEMKQKLADPNTMQPWLIEQNIPGIENILKGLDHFEKGAAISPAGRMYEVNINAHPDEFLSSDLNLNKQSPFVKDALRGAGIYQEGPYRSGALAYQDLADRGTLAQGLQQRQAQASDMLRDAGIPGIKYLDQGSRGSGTGTSNYVVFNDKLIDILRKYGLAGLTAGAGATAAGQQIDNNAPVMKYADGGTVDPVVLPQNPNPLADNPFSHYVAQKLYGLGQNAASALSVPGEVWKGNLDPTSDEGMNRAIGLAQMITEAPRGGGVGSGTVLGSGIRAYHGSPYDFDRFDLSKIGTGEGAQSYGHGLYFAENEGVARSYRDALTQNSGKTNLLTSYRDGILDDSPRTFERFLAARFRQNEGDLTRTISQLETDLKANPKDGTITQALDLAKNPDAKLNLIDRNPGRMYEVNINAHPDEFLDWDKPLGNQSYVTDRIPDIVEAAKKEAYNRALAATHKDRSDQLWGMVKNPLQAPGEFALDALVRGRRGVQSADTSAMLRDAGIHGIKYLDQGSRNFSLMKPEPHTFLDNSQGWRVNGPRGDQLFDTKQEAQDFINSLDKGTTRNYVVFNDKLIDILRKYGLAGLTAGAGATAVAGQNDMKYASGGNVLPFYARSEARNLEHSGFIHSPVPGRTDRLPMGVRGGSYVLPADTVSAVGQGNSLAGAHALTRLFGMGPYGSSMPHISGGRPSIPKLPSMKPPKFARGGPVDIVAAGGEMVIPPHVVAQIGKGDMKLGHDILDAFVKHTRAKTVKKLKSLPDPKKK